MIIINSIIVIIYLVLGVTMGIKAWNGRKRKDKNLCNFILNSIFTLIWPITIIMFVCLDNNSKNVK